MENYYRGVGKAKTIAKLYQWFVVEADNCITFLSTVLHWIREYFDGVYQQ